MASSDQGGTGADPLLEALIAQLRRSGVLTAPDIENMKRRLIESDHEDLADSLNWIILSDLIDDPGERRARIHTINGGKRED